MNMGTTLLEPFAAPLTAGASQLLRDLEARGWKVEMRPCWVVEASRGMDAEETVGATREEALGRLAELARLYEAGHLP